MIKNHPNGALARAQACEPPSTSLSRLGIAGRSAGHMPAARSSPRRASATAAGGYHLAMASRIVVVTGASGAGKTSPVQRLAQRGLAGVTAHTSTRSACSRPTRFSLTSPWYQQPRQARANESLTIGSGEWNSVPTHSS